MNVGQKLEAKRGNNRVERSFVLSSSILPPIYDSHHPAWCSFACPYLDAGYCVRHSKELHYKPDGWSNFQTTLGVYQRCFMCGALTSEQ